MNWISWLVGKSDKGIVDQVADGIDKFVYSGEEKAENQAKWESEVTKRWQADSEAPITRLTRPFLVIFTTIVIFVFGALDASLEGFSVSQQYLDLFTITWTVMITAYFGGRSFEKGIVRKK